MQNLRLRWAFLCRRRFYHLLRTFSAPVWPLETDLHYRYDDAAAHMVDVDVDVGAVWCVPFAVVVSGVG